MPIYEYRCDACEHHLSELQNINDKHLIVCPKCKSKSLRRLISAPVFRLKGSGWYETDFKSGKDKKRNLADTSEVNNVNKEKKLDKDKEGKSKLASNKSEESIPKKKKMKQNNDS